ncbi:MAG: TIM-barrel domain-containing protein [Phycisphaerales bacterium JB041]
MPRPFTRNSSQTAARSLRKGHGRPDNSPQNVGERITRFRDPRFADRTLRPSPALLSQPEPTGQTPSPAAAPTFADSGGWHTLRLDLEPGTDVYGTGEAAGPLLRNGRTISLRNTDAFGYDDTTEALYQSHPWVIGVRADGSAFGLLADSPRRGIISVERDILMAFEGEPFAAYLIERDSPQEVVRTLAELTGTASLPPLWSLGYHQCRWSYEPDSRVREVASEFRQRRIPCDVLWMDIDYMHGFRVFTFDDEKFPDPAALNRDLHGQGFHAVWMIDPGVKVDEGYDVYTQGRDGGHFITTADGAEFHGNVWPGPCAFPDFTRRRTRQWWATLYRDYMATGIDGVWNDMNEPAVFGAPGKTMPDTNRHDADDDLGGPDSHARYHNLYGMQMVRATLDGVRAANPEKRPFVLTRSNFLGGHRYAATWTGDNTSNWDHLRWSITMALGMGLSGQPFVGPDIGGFSGNADGHLFARWMGIGALLPFARGHSIKESVNHEPWSFGPRCELVCRLALERRSRLVPYLYTLFHEASRTGLPVARPLWFADPADAELRDVEDSFLLGADVLVRARTRFTGPCRAPLPGGGWARFEPVAPGDPELPELFLRRGSVLPLGPVRQHVAEAPLDPLTLIIHPDADGRATGLLYEDTGDGHGHERGQCRLTLIDATVDSEGCRVEHTVIEGDWDTPDRAVQTVIVRA